MSWLTVVPSLSLTDANDENFGMDEPGSLSEGGAEKEAEDESATDDDVVEPVKSHPRQAKSTSEASPRPEERPAAVDSAKVEEATTSERFAFQDRVWCIASVIKSCAQDGLSLPMVAVPKGLQAAASRACAQLPNATSAEIMQACHSFNQLRQLLEFVLKLFVSCCNS